jgi:hypothetical protein
MDELRSEFKKVKKKASPKALAEFHNKLASLKFLDPACGCGNFLIIAYRELRQLEHEVVREEFRLKGIDHKLLNLESHFLVNVDQFYGIEILTWPCQIAMTGMWLMDHLCNTEVSEEFGKHFTRIPLEKGATIVAANAHRIDWESLVPKNELNYIMGNPPFVGARFMQPMQKEDMHMVFGELKRIGTIDYVTAWYKKAADMMESTTIKTAFVSTNSITQGEQVAILWKPLMDRGIFINFGIPTFKWSNEAKGKAAVHCVIAGFSFEKTEPNINPYLIKAPTVFIESRNTPVCDVPEITTGNQATDDGHFYFDQEEYEAFLQKEPKSKPYIRKALGCEDFIKNRPRYCLWLTDADPQALARMPHVLERIAKVRDYRFASKKEATRKWAKMPSLFTENRQPVTNFLVIPKVTSETRFYVPIGFMSPDVICNNTVKILPNATLYHFAVITSNVHNAWMRAVCGRMKSDYTYSNDIVYNNFPWPDATEKQKAAIEKLAQGVLDARAQYPNSSLADIYGLTMPPNLFKAHHALDKAVMKLYGFPKDISEPEIVASLMEMYQKLVSSES